MKQFSFFIPALLFITACQQPEQVPVVPPVKPVVKDTAVVLIISPATDSNSVILKYDRAVFNFLPAKIKLKPAPLSKDEIKEADKLTFKVLTDGKVPYGDLTGFKRQYMAVFNNKGEKLIWINYFCFSTDFDWKNQPVITDDGGACFFQLTLNMAKMSCLYFWQDITA